MAVSPQDMRPLRVADRIRLGAEILVSYARVRWALRFRTPEAAVASLRRRRRRDPVSATPEVQRIVGLRLARAVVYVLRPLPTDVRCLNRSLTLLTMMERRDLHATVVLAVRPEPFAAHAWVELEGEALLPPADPDHGRLTEL